MLLLILFVLFFIVLKDRSLNVTSEQIVKSYISDKKAADAKFLNKEIELSGKVKSFFQFEVEKSLLELETGNRELQLFCLLMNKETEEIAESLTAGTTVKVFGKCLGLNPPVAVKFQQSIYIEAERIK